MFESNSKASDNDMIAGCEDTPPKFMIFTIHIVLPCSILTKGRDNTAGKDVGQGEGESEHGDDRDAEACEDEREVHVSQATVVHLK